MWVMRLAWVEDLKSFNVVPGIAVYPFLWGVGFFQSHPKGHKIWKALFNLEK